MKDGILVDGLMDPYDRCHMGVAAELCASKYNISREEQDAYCVESYNRAQRATDSQAFAREIQPVEVTIAGKPILIAQDEEYKRVWRSRVWILFMVMQEDI